MPFDLLSRFSWRQENVRRGLLGVAVPAGGIAGGDSLGPRGKGGLIFRVREI